MVGPGKVVVYVGARGYGAEALDFYQNPRKHGLVGETKEEMFAACAKAWGWESGEALEKAVDEVYSGARLTVPTPPEVVPAPPE